MEAAIRNCAPRSVCLGMWRLQRAVLQDRRRLREGRCQIVVDLGESNEPDAVRDALERATTTR